MSSSYHLQTTPVIGLPQFMGWSQVVVTDQERCSAAFSISGEHAGNVGRDVVAYLGEVQLRTSAEVYQKIQDIVSLVHDMGCEIQVALVVFQETRGIFAVYNGTIVLKRRGRVGQLIAADAEITLIEGRVSPDDLLVLLTAQARSFFGVIEQKLIQGYEKEPIATALASLIHDDPQGALAAVGFISQTSERGSHVDEPEPALLPETEFGSYRAVALRSAPNDETAIGTPVTDKKSRLVAVGSVGAKKLFQAGRALGAILRRGGRGLLAGVVSLIRKGSSENLYVSTGPVSHKKRLFMLALVVIGCIVLAVILYQFRQRQLLTAAAAEVAPVAARLETVRTTARENPVTARSELVQFLQEIEQQLQNEPEGSLKRQLLESHQAEVLALSQEISGLEELQELSVFYDLRLLESDVIAVAAESSETHAAFLDREKKVLVILDLVTKQARRVQLEQTPVDLAIVAQQAFVISKGVTSFAVSGDLSPQLVLEEGDSSRAGTLIAAFKEYLYIVNPEKRTLYRYAREGERYSEPIAWLRSTQGVAFDQVASLAIDGDVWLGMKDGSIKKYRASKPEPFTITGLAEPFTQSITVVTREDVHHLYVLDTAKRRVVILTKDGVFVRQVTNQALASASSLLVSEKMGKIFAISGSLIFELPL